MKRCNERAEVKAEHELRELEGFARPPPLPDWEPCPNCGEKYGPTAIAPHVRRCKRLRPNGANGFCARGSDAFSGLWGVGDLQPYIQQLQEQAGLSDAERVKTAFAQWDQDGNGFISKEELTAVIKQLCPAFTDDLCSALFDAADSNKDGALDYNEFCDFLFKPKAGPELSEEDLAALRALFNRFDEDKDALLSTGEFNNLMRNMLPRRAGDFTSADSDGSGGIDFDEFVKYWLSVAGSVGFQADLLDEAADMFDAFDKDNSGEIDQHEFLALLNNVFPDHCEENEAHVTAEFSACDDDGSNGIDFMEFLAYYERLKQLYDAPPGTPAFGATSGKRQRKIGWPPADADERQASLDQEFVTSPCGLKFLPDRLQVHIRACEACKEAEAARRRAEEERRRKEAEEEEERRRRAAEEAERRRREAEDAEARRRWEEEEAEELRRRQEEEEAKRRKRKAEPEVDENGFVRCPYCSRTFFPDRLQVHFRVCKKRKEQEGGLCRETVVPGEDPMNPTRGRYVLPV
eukprot:TRINITY_DN13744_c0_g1_i2.p1 TRINITY_DN13744_c0_g1~~TRINITY_DN13744_c0_g1_i2.p1  ORF type:complete len:519 (-),score=136.25 TRINITY_DN13744_c0_g1_i2:226-1782(-)